MAGKYAMWSDTENRRKIYCQKVYNNKFGLSERSGCGLSYDMCLEPA